MSLVEYIPLRTCIKWQMTLSMYFFLMIRCGMMLDIFKIWHIFWDFFLGQWDRVKIKNITWYSTILVCGYVFYSHYWLQYLSLACRSLFWNVRQWSNPGIVRYVYIMREIGGKLVLQDAPLRKPKIRAIGLLKPFVR